MHRGPVLSALNRRVLSPVIHLIYRLIFGEGPFVTTLKKGPRTANGLAATIHRVLGGAIEEGFNLWHTLRKEILEDYAQERNLLLVGAANRSEAFVGWFVKDGIDDLPVEPIIGLYKTQVRQLAGFLAVPQEIIREHPSPDMAGGMADEDIIGYPYLKIDRVAYATEHGLGEEVISAAGITKTEFENIRALNKLSAWKRRNEHTFPAFP
ncbi:NAD(+) synthase [Chloroflexota bacterium]